MPIDYTHDTSGLRARHLEGFFVGWASPPDPATHLQVLRASHAVWLAVDEGRCVGFINAISDGLLHAYIPLLEVLPDWQGRGIGSELTRRMLETLAPLYAIDIVCDADVVPFYERLGLQRCCGMIRRNR